MEFNFKSNYYHLSGQTLSWLPMDTEELYKKNLKTNFKDLEENGWIDKTITYKFNSNGFRCDDFNNDTNILFLGCSLTIGIGINAQDRWTDIVGDKLGLKCYNLGIGGGSCDTAYRLLLGWIHKLNPSIVILRRTIGIRIELTSEKEIINLLSNQYRRHFLDNFMNYYSKDDINDNLNYMKNVMAMKYLCSQHKVKFIELIPYTSENDIDKARDLAHPGIKTNKAYANYVLTLI